jgi:hypothetical protein
MASTGFRGFRIHWAVAPRAASMVISSWQLASMMIRSDSSSRRDRVLLTVKSRRRGRRILGLFTFEFLEVAQSGVSSCAPPTGGGGGRE